MTGWLAGHRKLLAAAAGALVTVLVDAFGTSNPWVAAMLLAATSFGVYRAPNQAAAPAAAPVTVTREPPTSNPAAPPPAGLVP